ncbi:MAG: DUF5988 family protein [Streptosporangiaceae bacterium]|jgi:hypothetical protein
MDSTAKTTSTINPVRAILHGGPQSIPNETRVQLVSPLDEKIKLPHYGGYEHFERIAAIDTSGILEEIAFHWTMRTELAE